MKPEVKRLWIEALRSGEYKQAKGMLARSEGFCCLGVLCQISGLNYTRTADFLPDTVREWAGLECNDPTVTPENDDELSLSGLNDQGSLFAEIATLIERYL